MSYDVYLNERVSGEVIHFDYPHLMIGGTFEAIYDERTGDFYPKPTTKAHLNITYNYGSYYHEAVEGDDRFLVTDYKGEKSYNGIRGLYGKTGLESISMLSDMIFRITKKYKPGEDWITSKRKVLHCYDMQGNEIHPWEAIIKKIENTAEVVVEDIYEGPNDDYWKATAANAIRPLYQLMTFAKYRPDGVWDGD